MASASDYLEQQIYNHIFRNATFSKPSNLFLGLTKDVPLDDGTYTEIDGAGYARYAEVSGDALWSAMGAAGTGSNVGEFVFAQATADWGEVSGVIVTDAATAGNVLLHGELAAAKTVGNNDTFKFAAGALAVEIA